MSTGAENKRRSEESSLYERNWVRLKVLTQRIAAKYENFVMAMRSEERWWSVETVGSTTRGMVGLSKLHLGGCQGAPGFEAGYSMETGMPMHAYIHFNFF